MGLLYTYSVVGSPAHAGIDLGMGGNIGPSNRFPRTRGDRPCYGTLDASAYQVPPHTRG